MNRSIDIPTPINEPVLDYTPGSAERIALEAELERLASNPVEIPLVIGGEEVRTGDVAEITAPHDHSLVLGRWHRAGRKDVEAAIESSLAAWETWSRMPWLDRASIFLRAADLVAGPYRAEINAATMLGQSKTAYQAEIDSACELVDFYRFGASFAQEIFEQQPISSDGVWNRTEYRPLEGFIYAVSPFNFTAIGGNLFGAPAMLGNVAIWKPSISAVYSNWVIMKVLRDAGLPAGVVNFVPGDPAEVTDVVLSHPEFAGLHYTGSTEVFRMLWRKIGDNLPNYRNYPRIVGETGGKDFIVVHPSARADQVRTAIVRGAFEYQGQKCSAASRVYVPASMWAELKDDLAEEVAGLAMGSPRDFRNFLTAVIHEQAFEKIAGYIDRAKASDDVEVLVGGGYDRSKGWFIEPTVLVAKDPQYESMREEIFGPVVTIHVYDDEDWSDTLQLVDETSPYGLTGAVFSQDREATLEAMDVLRHAAGNFYINDKPTGAVVGQQPFGGARASGTNDKAGSALNLLRWLSPRSVKETFDPPTDYRYPFMQD
ncbi:MAG TPA: L-glutamate gamma-semialdehyde dehydrogenase [Longimicrobiales bacterium]|nr:L-glutamate gamma-semialdehyde dehydrogenase [Longimicrobiales bacterium]